MIGELMNRSKNIPEDIQGLQLANLIMFRSLDPESGNWEPIKRDDVPDWVKDDPEVVKHLINGWIAHNDNLGGYHYRAENAENAKSPIITLN